LKQWCAARLLSLGQAAQYPR
jgi:hypothetical protein